MQRVITAALALCFCATIGAQPLWARGPGLPVPPPPPGLPAPPPPPGLPVPRIIVPGVKVKVKGDRGKHLGHYKVKRGKHHGKHRD